MGTNGHNDHVGASLHQLPSVNLGTMTMLGPVMPQYSYRYATRLIVCSVLPTPWNRLRTRTAGSCWLGFSVIRPATPGLYSISAPRAGPHPAASSSRPYTCVGRRRDRPGCAHRGALEIPGHHSAQGAA
eukprot:361513-Chlamydomonas_euryale.AAC.2